MKRTKAKISPPYIQKEWKKHIYQITGGEKPGLEAYEALRQSFFGGFAKGIMMGTAEFKTINESIEFLNEIKNELINFSEENRKSGLESGRGYVNTRDL